jgi:hypothetical protein
MSPASYLTAPPRVAADHCTTVRLYHPRVIWIALAFCLLAVIGSVAFASVRAWRLWRTVRATSTRATEAVGRVTASAAAAEQHAVSLTAGTERLAAATERLQASLAELAVLRAAASETGALLVSIRGLGPRK